MPVAEKEKKTMAKAAATSSDSGPSIGSSNFITRSRDFLNDVRSEMRKVVTPSREEVQNTTLVVIISVFLFAAFFFAVDSVLGAALKALIHALGGTQ
ncbi:MAG: preprotein translocase subunit SecE [Acidobacteria bacterium]|jgi:preprotein translocase subunit SecE|nr:preprotein translocase subunit SecE [Acidobacteriota bacterium]